MPIDMTSTESLVLFASAFFIAAFVKGTIGLGFSTTALAILVLFIGVKPSIPLIIIPSLSSNLLVMAEVGHFRQATSRFWPMYLATVPGLILGLTVLANSESTTLGALLGFVLLVYGFSSLMQPNFRLPTKLERPLSPISGFLTGVFNGMTGSQVIPILPYLLSLKLKSEEFIQTMNTSFSISTVFIVIGLIHLKLITWEAMIISLAGVVPMVIGLKFGSMVRRRLDQKLFRILVLCFLILAGVLLIAKLF